MGERGEAKSGSRTRPDAEALWEIRVRCPRSWAEWLADEVAEVWSVSPVVEYHPGDARAAVVAFLEEVPVLRRWREQCAELRRRVKQRGPAGAEWFRWQVRGRRLPREDWAESWKQHFAVLEVGPLVVYPSWERPAPRPGRVEVVLDPGLSFGTGHHPTTRYCLEELVRLRQLNGVGSLLDAGTGSGLLAIAAAKLGYHPVEGIDYDESAVRTARENARVNGVADRVSVGYGDLLRLPRRGRRYDVICANVSAAVLTAARERLTARLAAGGWLVAAGILAREFEGVRSAFAGLGLACMRSRRDGRWRSGTFRRGAGAPRADEE